MARTGRPRNKLSKELILRNIQLTETGCWEWTGYRQGKPKFRYGRVTIARKGYWVHRLVMQLWKNFDYDSSLRVLHKCDNPPCCNPAHLFTGTLSDNTRDMHAKGRAKAISGEKSLIGKLTAKKVKAILTSIDSGEIKRRIAERFNVHPTTITELGQGKYWKSVWEEHYDQRSTK